jgi:pyridoxamine 5'-phosphate oxidase
MSNVMHPEWLERLKIAVKKNRGDAHNRYLQLATIGVDGNPRVRMVVFRGFSDADASLFIVTDARSTKIGELTLSSSVEASWYFTKTREQYRFTCNAVLYTPMNDPASHRGRLWSALSEPAQLQFFWRSPGLPVGEGDTLDRRGDDPPDNFVAVELLPRRVDHLVLGKTQSRTISERFNEAWSDTPVNP